MTFKPGKFVSVLLLSTLGLSACGSDDNSTESASAPVDCAVGSISGAGSTFVQNIVQQWVKDYSGSCPGATINYQGVGSGAGIQQFTAGTVDFAGSDAALKAEERTAAEAKHGPVVQIPWSSGAIAIEYKLDGVDELSLSPATLASIFSGTITKWNDAAIKADNSSVTLPDTPIQVIHRSDGSGTTQAFTEYLTAAADGRWAAGSGKDIKWPTGQGAKGSDGVTAAVKAANGTISYAELSFAKANSLGVAKVKNASGAFVTPDAANVTAALSAAAVESDGKVKLNYTATDPAAYALVAVTYVMAPKAGAEASKTALTRSFIDYALDGGQASSAGLSYAPLPDKILTSAKSTAESIGK